MNILTRLGKWKWPAIVPAAMIAVIGLAVLYFYLLQDRNRWDRKFGVVREGVLLRGCQPNPVQLESLKRDYGIKTIISLVHWDDFKNRPDCAAERELAPRRGMRFLHMPLSIPRPEQIKQFLEIVDNPKNCPVFMHCLAGTMRTGMLAAVFRMERDGWSNQQALDEMVSYGFILSNPEHKEMIDFVLGYRTSTKAASGATSLPHRADAPDKGHCVGRLSARLNTATAVNAR